MNLTDSSICQDDNMRTLKFTEIEGLLRLSAVRGGVLDGEVANHA